MKAIIKRNLKNYLKNPIFWIGLIVVLISMYQTLAPYLSIHYVKSDETFRKVKMASDGDVMEGCIPATPDKERELWEKEIVKILQDTENGFGMSEAEAEAVISEMKQMKITEACQYLKTEYHFNGANYVYEDVSWYQEARRKSTGISEKILRNIHSPIISEENLQILQACIWHSLQRFCWRFYFSRI